MQINLVLFSMLRERLAKESRGRMTVEMPEGSTIADVIAKLDVKMAVICSLNGQIERNFDTELHDGDEMQLFQPVGGGSTHGSEPPAGKALGSSFALQIIEESIQNHDQEAK